ncbi:MAG: hypothetical protein ACRCWY_06280 [Cellulosilyticaceae bacterium]
MVETIQVNEGTYQIVKLLGKGKGGYSYLVTQEGKQYVIKQIHHEPCSYYTFGNKIEAELTAYHTLKVAGIALPELLEVDERNERILKAFIDGPTIYELVVEDKMQAIYIQQIKEMCGLLYPLKLNIDYFPTNFIVCEGKLWYIDYECNTYMEAWNFENWGVQYWCKSPAFIAYEKENNK